MAEPVKIPRLFTITDDDQIILHPHRYQLYAAESQKRFVFMLKGMQAGATSWMPHIAFREMQRCGPGSRTLTYLGITPTQQVGRNKLIPEFVSVFCDTMKIGRHIKAPKEQIEITPAGEQRLWGHRQKEPTSIMFCHAQDPDSYAGFTALAAFGDEIGQKLFKRSSWMELLGRLSIPSGMVAPYNPPGWEGVKMGRFFGGTTVYELNWIETLYNEWEKSGCNHPQLDFIRFDSTENPAFPRKEWELAKATLPDWLFDMRYRALFRQPAGAIFEAWNPKTHIIDASPTFGPGKMPKSFIYGCGIDFGRRNFFATMWAKDPATNRFWLIDSYHRTDLSIQAHAAEILRIAREGGYSFDSQSVVAGQISEDHERMELHAGGLTALAPAYKDLWTGINNVNAAMKLDKIKLFSGVCPQMEDEFRTYSRPIDSAGNVLLDKDPDEKDTYHYCFVAGTSITVPGGQAPVETIEPGQYVVTREGNRLVTATGGRQSPSLIKIELSDGRTLTGTPDHPIFIQGKQFVRMDSLRYGDIIYSFHNLLGANTCTTNPSFSKANLIGAIPTLRDGVTGAISRTKERLCTAKCGSLRMARYRLATRFTTRTTTRSTTLLRTWKSLLAPNTPSLAGVGARPPHAQISISNALSQRRGTLARRVENGTLRIASKVGQSVKSLRERASSAPGPSKRGTISPAGFVPIIASPHGAATISEPLDHACTAMRNFQPRKIIRRLTALLRAAPQPCTSRSARPEPTIRRKLVSFARGVVMGIKRPRSARREPAAVYVVRSSAVAGDWVYNLQVQGAPEYFANGILVHNCDGVRYLMSRWWNPLLASSAELRAGSDKNLTPVRNTPDAPPAVMLHSGMSRHGQARARKYGFDDGCVQPHLDITVR